MKSVGTSIADHPDMRKPVYLPSRKGRVLKIGDSDPALDQLLADELVDAWDVVLEDAAPDVVLAVVGRFGIEECIRSARQRVPFKGVVALIPFSDHGMQREAIRGGADAVFELDQSLAGLADVLAGVMRGESLQDGLVVDDAERTRGALAPVLPFRPRGKR
ncbi:MAG: hypothetical protein AB2A00_39060 [Myxococcota bacterium]